jgi:hypothetical protein
MVGEESRRVVTPATAAVAELAGGGPPPVSESQNMGHGEMFKRDRAGMTERVMRSPLARRSQLGRNGPRRNRLLDHARRYKK